MQWIVRVFSLNCNPLPLQSKVNVSWSDLPIVSNSSLSLQTSLKLGCCVHVTHVRFTSVACQAMQFQLRVFSTGFSVAWWVFIYKNTIYVVAATLAVLIVWKQIEYCYVFGQIIFGYKLGTFLITGSMVVFFTLLFFVISRFSVCITLTGTVPRHAILDILVGICRVIAEWCIFHNILMAYPLLRCKLVFIF